MGLNPRASKGNSPPSRAEEFIAGVFPRLRRRELAFQSTGVQPRENVPRHLSNTRNRSHTMPTRLYPRFETPIDGPADNPSVGSALARVIEAHPALAPLLDFCAVDPHQIAVEVGMVYPYEEDGLEDLDELDFGPDEWFEPSAGLAVLNRAIAAVRDDPESIAAAIYDPTLRSADVLADLEAIAGLLEAARQHETRFHFRETP